MNRIVPIALILASLTVLAGCLTDKGELVDDAPPEGFCDSISATYVDTMAAIINTHCANSSGCHGTLATNGDFTTYANMEAAGVLSQSKVGARVSSNDITFVMPPGNPLPDSLRQVFQCWVLGGFPQQ